MDGATERSTVQESQDCVELGGCNGVRCMECCSSSEVREEALVNNR